MRKHNYSGWWAVLTILLLIIIDQIIKVWVKTSMHLGESIHIADWFYISFIENNGMAYGMSFIYKPLLTLFRIAAVSFIGYYLYKLILKKARMSYILIVAMVCAGAAGNIIDCVLYGQIFTASTPWNVAELVPFGQGYAPVLEGKVVDMFYFPLIVTTYPDWFPMWGGERFVFFSPVFNFADSCISVGVVLLMLFYRKELEDLWQTTIEGTSLEKKAKTNETNDNAQ